MSTPAVSRDAEGLPLRKRAFRWSATVPGGGGGGGMGGAGGIGGKIGGGGSCGEGEAGGGL